MRSIHLRALLVGSLLALPAGAALIARSYWPDAALLLQSHFYLGTDFVNYWSGGRLALQGRVDIVYDLGRYLQALREWFGAGLRFMNFSYPPHSLLLLALPAALPYLAALAAWSLAGIAAFIAVALGAAPQRKDALLICAIVLSPIVWCNVVLGQFGLLLAALFVGALRALPTRPVLAGVLIGVLTVKPQLGLLLAPMLIVLGAWRAFAAAAATGLLLVGLSVAAFGAEPWRIYLAETLPFQWHFVEVMDGFYRFQMVTPYTALWFLGAPMQLAVALQTLMSLVVVVVALAAVRGAAPWPLKAAVVAFGSVLMVPYVLSYDLAIPLAALIWCLRAGVVRTDAFAIALIATLWALPFGLQVFTQTHGVPLLPLLLIATFAWLAQQALTVRSHAAGTAEAVAR